VASVAAALSIHTPAEAGTKEACVKSFEEGQVLRRRSKLVDARAAFGICAQAECPSVVSAKCAEWVTEVDRSIPTIVLGARLDGEDTADAHVSIDGVVVYFGLSALDESSHLRTTCAPTCDPSDVSEIKTKNVISGISLGVGLVAIGVAAYWLATSFSSTPEDHKRNDAREPLRLRASP
jgi:hypothetical protein